MNDRKLRRLAVHSIGRALTEAPARGETLSAPLPRPAASPISLRFAPTSDTPGGKGASNT